jgi:hypothetical protein
MRLIRSAPAVLPQVVDYIGKQEEYHRSKTLENELEIFEKFKEISGMNKLQYKFSGKTTTYYFDADFSYLEKLVDRDQTVLITDEHMFSAQQKKFGGWNTIVINAGEQYQGAGDGRFHH